MTKDEIQAARDRIEAELYRHYFRADVALRDLDALAQAAMKAAEPESLIGRRVRLLDSDVRHAATGEITEGPLWRVRFPHHLVTLGRDDFELLEEG